MLGNLSAAARSGLDNAKDRGASAVEYGLMIAAIAAVITGIVFGLGGLVAAAFSKTCTAMSQTVDPGDCLPPGSVGP